MYIVIEDTVISYTLLIMCMTDKMSPELISLDDVIEFKINGFTVNTDAMHSEKKYRFKFEGSVYEMWENVNDELEMMELPNNNE